MNATPAPSDSPDAGGRPVDRVAGAEAPETAALVRQAQRGDTAAFEQLYRRHVGRVRALCLRLGGDAARADTLTQDVFVRAWRKLPLFEGRSAFGTWLHRLAVNVVVEEMRAEARRSRRVVFIEDLSGLDVPRPAAPPGTELDLERAIATLPPGARLVFVLHDVQGYRHEEIANLTGLAVGTSKSHLHRARRLLREVLT